MYLASVGAHVCGPAVLRCDFNLGLDALEDLVQVDEGRSNDDLDVTRHLRLIQVGNELLDGFDGSCKDERACSLCGF